MQEQVFCAFLGNTLRDDFIPYVADFYLQLEDVKWTIVAGIVGESLHVVRISDIRGTPASSCASTSPTSAAPAVIAPWPRRSCQARSGEVRQSLAAWKSPSGC
jgi:hypothetical protein